MNTYEAALREIYNITITSGPLTSDGMVEIISLKASEALAVPAPPVEPYKPDMMGAVTITGEPIASRQDQGVVGTQGREAFIQKVLEEFPPMGSKYEAADFMRAHWPVSEGEGMNGWVSASVRPEKAGEYLVVYAGPHKTTVAKSFYYSADGWDGYKHNDYQVTHWQKLPSPPQNQK